MANISVVELLSDPDFCDPCTVLRQVQTVDQFGIAQVSVVSIPILASIQSASGDDLVMTADAARTSASYEIITTFLLLTASDATAADIVQWGGEEFTVIHVDRFGNFAGGLGHYEGVMALKPTVRQSGDIVWLDNGASVVWQDSGTPMIWKDGGTP